MIADISQLFVTDCKKKRQVDNHETNVKSQIIDFKYFMIKMTVDCENVKNVCLKKKKINNVNKE